MHYYKILDKLLTYKIYLLYYDVCTAYNSLTVKKRKKLDLYFLDFSVIMITE